MAAENLTLKESIEKALVDQQTETKEKSSEEATKETPEETKEVEETEKQESDEKKVEEEVEETEKKSDAEAEEIDTALNLLRTLRDPSKSTDLVRDFATRLGIINTSEDLTKKQEKDLKSIIAEQLGEDYPDLTEKLSKILELSEARSKQEIKSLREELQQEKRLQAEQAFSAEFSNFIKSNKLSESEAALMVEQIKELPPSGNITLTNYLTKIRKLVTSDKIEVKTKIDQNTKREQNQKERVRNLSSEADDSRIKNGSRLPTAREAIEAAARGESFDE